MVHVYLVDALSACFNVLGCMFSGGWGLSGGLGPLPIHGAASLANVFSSIRLWARCSVTHGTMSPQHRKLIRCVLTVPGQ